MALTTGTRLGPYQIDSALGAGGMGEVYRAKDTRLDRTVAIKVLPAVLAADAEFRERFEREAKSISALNHPHICTLFDVGHQDGIEYLVMEFIEGETLASRLEKGPLPLPEALQIGAEIASALDSAHRQGIVHRDLKPGNIMLTKTGAKLLDFGLAKAASAGVISTSGTIAKTMTTPLTAQGTILGTFQYMAPEQIEGEEADARTDIFAFGVVFFEMITGRKAFTGKSQAGLLGAILKEEPPPVSQIQPVTPPLLDYVVRTCLAKDPDNRFQTAHDLQLQLRWIADGGSAAGVPAPVVAHRRHRERTAWIAATALFLLWLATLVPAAWYFSRTPEERQIQFLINTPEIANPFQFGVSPDGRLVAFVAAAPSGAGNMLWLRPIASTTAQPIAGTTGAASPFWSPDSRHIGFSADRKLKRVDVTGGPPQSLCDVATFAGGSWNRNNVIVFSNATVLQRVSASGGEPTAVTKPDPSRQETRHLFPSFLPDGRHFLFLVWSQIPESRVVYVASLDSSERTRVAAGDSMTIYAPPGFLLFERQGTLMAQPFDVARARTTGEAFRVADDIAGNVATGRAAFSVSENGVLVYRTGGIVGGSAALTWFDRRGKSLGTVGEPGPFRQVRLSPDQKRVAVERIDPRRGANDIWTIDLINSIPARLTFDTSGAFDPVWSPDGRTVAFASRRNGKLDLFQKALGANADSPLFESADVVKFLDDWSVDGRFVLFHGDSGFALYAAPLTGNRKPIRLIDTPYRKDEAHFSFDGRWVAYQSNESGTLEAYVASFPGFENRTRVSAHGGSEPRWRQDGKELFYLDLDGKLMSVAVKAGAAPEFGAPKILFQAPISLSQVTAGIDLYDVSPDGQRFIVLSPTQPDSAAAVPITVVVNWTAGFIKK